MDKLEGLYLPPDAIQLRLMYNTGLEIVYELITYNVESSGEGSIPININTYNVAVSYRGEGLYVISNINKDFTREHLTTQYIDIEEIDNSIDIEDDDTRYSAVQKVAAGLYKPILVASICRCNFEYASHLLDNWYEEELQLQLLFARKAAKDELVGIKRTIH